ncbi:retrovirus-related pol polyprotein from transposon TNT 1-94 [Tanacetum coccineum]|uniref:Retrovirus-related pol polyprotein from transposon TNT 1-94 n=1 Tax=Tanacetum coccineum TaxID=301880 RepID=A0ABQ4YWM9_9ASTR
MRKQKEVHSRQKQFLFQSKAKFASHGLVWTNASCKHKGKKYNPVICRMTIQDTLGSFSTPQDETPEVLKRLSQPDSHAISSSSIYCYRTDRGTEFLNKTLHAYFKEEGIEHQTFTPRTLEQNCVVERRNRTINRSIIISTHGKTAYHIINDRKPLIKHLHIFGCICYITRDGENLDKMKEKGDPCVMVGYSTQSKGYRVYNKRTRLIVCLVPQGQKASDYDNSDPVPPRQNVVPTAKKTDSSQQGLEFLLQFLFTERKKQSNTLSC